MARNLQARKEYFKQYGIKNREKIYQYQKEWKSKNKERIVKWYKDYGLKNKDKIKSYLKEWYKKNKTRVLQQQKEYCLKNKELVKQQHKRWRERNIEYWKKYSNKWRRDHPESRRIYERTRRNANIQERLADNIRRRIASDLILRHGSKNRKHWEDLVGFTVEELRQHLELFLKPEMNWENYGIYWEIDHIKPISSFKFASYEDEEFKKCWALDNLQPLTCLDNRSKGKKYGNNGNIRSWTN